MFNVRCASTNRRELYGQGLRLYGCRAYNWRGPSGLGDQICYDMVLVDRLGNVVPFVEHGERRVAGVNLNGNRYFRGSSSIK